MPDSNALDNLIKTENSANVKLNLEKSKKFQATKNRIKGICKFLSSEATKYKPERTVEHIEDYVKAKDKITRILYSEISNYLFNLEPQQKESFLTNVESLMIYALGNDSIDDDVAKIIVKIYDHTQLVNYQIESMNNIFAQRIVDAKMDLQKEVKGIEKEYITILGIFAAIVLAFVGSFTFSTSVLNNIAKVNIVELSVIALIIGIVLFNLIAYLIDFLKEINDKVDYNAKGKKIISPYRKVVNAVLIVLVIAMIAFWVVTKIKFPEKVYIGVTQEQVDDTEEVDDNK